MNSGLAAMMPAGTAEPILSLEHSYARDLEGLYVPWRGAPVPSPAIIALNEPLAAELGLDLARLRSPGGAAILAGSHQPEAWRPLAQAYAGHQFGGFSPQLGDGRALLIGEVIGPDGTRRDIHLKGSGRTPFSRGGDGKATLGPMLREFLIGEAMHALAIPTTRALAVTTTGEDIARETFQPGAVLARVASSHLRVGTFQFFAARGDRSALERLVDYAIRRHDPHLVGVPNPALALLAAVADRQAALIARWMAVGFVHGVMNTDNVAISGETIDYGPCAFIDGHHPTAVFSSIDHAGRYAYGNQPAIARWNMARFAETLLDLIAPDDPDRAVALATEEIERMAASYRARWLAAMRAKLGLARIEAGDEVLADGLIALMAAARADHTAFFRALAGAAGGEADAARTFFPEPSAFDAWCAAWRARLDREEDGPAPAAARMDRTNPLVIPRNHVVEAALEAAVRKNDMAPFRNVLALLRAPFDAAPGSDDLARPPPPGTERCVTFCGT